MPAKPMWFELGDEADVWRVHRNIRGVAAFSSLVPTASRLFDGEQQWRDDCRVDLHGDGFVGEVFKTTSGHFVSPRVAELLEERFPGAARYFPLRAVHRDTGATFDYFLIVPEVAYTETGIFGDEKIDFAALPDAPLFLRRIPTPTKGLYLGRVVVRDDLARLLIDANVTGLGFLRYGAKSKPVWMKEPARRFPELDLVEPAAPEPGSAEAAIGIALAATSLEEGWRALLASCRKQSPDPAWDKLAAWDVAADGGAALDAFTGALAASPLPRSIAGLYLGMRLGASTEDASLIYLGGSTEYQPGADGDPEWACEFAWDPDEARYFSKVLFRLEYERSDGAAGDLQSFFLQFGWSALLAGELIRRVGAAKLLGKRKFLGIATGHDDGDLYVLGDLTPQGFRPC